MMLDVVGVTVAQFDDPRVRTIPLATREAPTRELFTRTVLRQSGMSLIVKLTYAYQQFFLSQGIGRLLVESGRRSHLPLRHPKHAQPWQNRAR